MRGGVAEPAREKAAGETPLTRFHQRLPYRDAIPFARTLIETAPERVLWGTDFPHPNVKVMPNDGELVDLFAAFCDDDALRRKVLVDNPTRLYWADAGENPAVSR